MSSPPLDGCQSGRLGTPGERVYCKVPRVRIPPHPQPDTTYLSPDIYVFVPPLHSQGPYNTTLSRLSEFRQALRRCYFKGTLADSMSDDDSLSPEEKDKIRQTQQLSLWTNLYAEYVAPKPDSIMGLAGRLKIWQEFFGRPPADNLTPFEKIEERVNFKVTQEFHQEQQQALAQSDHKLLRKIAEAAKLLAEAGGKPPSHGLDVTGAAVYAFDELRRELGRLPTYDQIRKRVEEWLGQPVSEKHWKRVLKVLAPLYRPSGKVK